MHSICFASRLRIALIATLCACVFVGGCGRKKRGARMPAAPRINSIETGVASWYGYPYHGRRAANGEIYDMEKLTAAHRTLPFGTWVEVENLDNGKVVTVRITDRGPFVGGRVIDLSKAAAREIAMIGPGLARVKLKIVAPPPGIPQVGTYAVQIGAFQDQSRAESLRRKFEADYGSARLVLRAGKPAYWRVLVGAESTIDAANELRDRIGTAGQEAFVVLLDDATAPPPTNSTPATPIQ